MHALSSQDVNLVACSLKYLQLAVDISMNTSPKHIILTQGQPALLYPSNSECSILKATGVDFLISDMNLVILHICYKPLLEKELSKTFL